MLSKHFFFHLATCLYYIDLMKCVLHGRVLMHLDNSGKKQFYGAAFLELLSKAALSSFWKEYKTCNMFWNLKRFFRLWKSTKRGPRLVWLFESFQVSNTSGGKNRRWFLSGRAPIMVINHQKVKRKTWP